MEEFNSSPPQPEDPGRALDPGLEEDPDISVELVDGTFYQASHDGALVAILADYPGLLPVSNVSKAGALNSELCRALSAHVVFLQKQSSRRRAEPTGAQQQEASGSGRRKRKAVRTETPGQRYKLDLLCDYLC